MRTATLLLLLLTGCQTGDASDTTDTCASVPYNLTWANWGDGFFSNYCRACHSVDSQERFDAPADINFDTKDEVIALKDDIYTQVITDDAMPVGGGVYDQDKEFLGYFLTCGLK